MSDINETLRHELKFLISSSQADIIQQKLKALLPYDPNGADGTYLIESVYFDDFYSTFLKEKLDGAEKGPKFRIRAYNQNYMNLKLERKQKKGDLVAKKSAKMDKDRYDSFIRNSMSFSKDFEELHTTLLRPKVIVSYERTAFVYEPGHVRITLDRHLKTSINHEPSFFKPNCFREVFDDERVIFEVKYTGFLPIHLKGFLNESGSKQSLSKYAICRLSS